MTKSLAEQIVSEIADLIETDRGLVMSRAVERVEMVLKQNELESRSGLAALRRDKREWMRERIEQANEKLWQELGEEPAGPTGNQGMPDPDRDTNPADGMIKISGDISDLGDFNMVMSRHGEDTAEPGTYRVNGQDVFIGIAEWARKYQ